MHSRRMQRSLGSLLQQDVDSCCVLQWGEPMQFNLVQPLSNFGDLRMNKRIPGVVGGCRVVINVHDFEDASQWPR